MGDNIDKKNYNMEIRLATIEELENWWDEKIRKDPQNYAYKVCYEKSIGR